MSKVYHLKHSTHREQYRWMKSRMEFNSALTEAQDKEYERRMEVKRKCKEVCQSIADLISPTEYAAWWETTPDDDDGFLNAAREKLTTLHRAEQETTAQECERINQWLTDNWDNIPEVEF
jgi:hypothetical protein